jgi:hypothetical protein
LIVMRVKVALNVWVLQYIDCEVPLGGVAVGLVYRNLLLDFLQD